jgi:hypothetical protein
MSAKLDALGEAGTVDVLGVELPNAVAEDTYVTVLLSGINVTSPQCTQRIWHIPRNKILSSSPLKDASCPGGDVIKYLVATDAIPIEEVFVPRPLRDLIGSAGGRAVLDANDKTTSGRTERVN